MKLLNFIGFYVANLYMKMSRLSPSGFLQRKQASKKWGWWVSSNLASQNRPDLGDKEEEEENEAMPERFLKLPLLLA